MLRYLDLVDTRRAKHWRLGRCYVNDTTINAGIGGDKIRDFDDSVRKWPASFICFGTVSDPGPITSPTVVQGYATAFPVGISFNNAQIDPRSIRALTSADVVSAVQSGTWTVGLSAGSNVIGAVTQSGTWNITVNTALPTGSNTIGAVTQASGPWTINVTQIGGSPLAFGQAAMASSLPVVIASNQTAIPVTQSGTWTVGLSAGSNLIGHIDGSVASGSANANNPVKVGLVFNTTQPTVTTGQVVDAQATARGAAIVATGADVFNVTVNVALPTGSNTIGAVQQAGTWTVGTNADSSVGAGTAPAKALLIAGVFNSTLPTLTTGQVAGIQVDANGRLLVNIASGAGSGGTAQNDGATFTASTTPGTPIQGAFNDSLAAVTSGTVDAVRITPNRGLHVNIRNQSGTELATAAAPLRIDPVGTTAQPVTQSAGPWTVNGPVASGAANANNPVKTGGVFNTTQPTVTTGQVVDAQYTAHGAAIVATGTDTFNVTVNAALPTGANTIGAVNQAGTWNVTVNTALPTGANTIGAVTQASGPWTINVTQVGGSALALGQAVMASSVPVVIASNQTAVPVSQSGTWTFTPTSPSDRTTIGQSLLMTSAGNTVALAIAGDGTASVQITGTWTGTIIFEATTDGTNWYTINATVPTTGAIVTTTTAGGSWLVPCAGYAQIRLRGSIAGTGTATVSIEASAGTQAVTVANALPTGANTIGAVTQAAGPWTVNVASALPAGANNIGSVNIGAALPTGANTIGAVTQASGPWTINLTQVGGTALSLGQAAMASSIPVVIASNQSAVPASQSGTWTVQQGSAPWSMQGPVASGAANANNPVKTGGVFNSTQPTVTTGQVVDAQYTARGGAIVATGADTFNVTVNTALPTGANTIGAVTQAGAPWSVSQSGTWNVGLNAGSNLIGHIDGAVASGGGNANNPVKIGGVFNSTQPTVTNGQIVDAQYTARGGAIVATGVDTFNVTVNTALPTGANVIGGVTQSGTWTMATNADSSVGAGGAPAKSLLIAGVFNTSLPTLTTGQVAGVQVDSNGRLLVNIAAGAAAGGTSSADGAAFTAGTTAGTAIQGVFNDGLATVTSGTLDTARITNNRALHVNLRTAAGVEIGTAASPVRIDPVGTTTQPTNSPDKTSITQNLVMTATTNAVTLALGSGQSTASVQITGATWTGTVIFEGNVDGTNWFPIEALTQTTGALATTFTGNGSNVNFFVSVAGLASVRVRVSIAGTNTAIVSIEASIGSGLLLSSLPTGSNVIGGVTQSGTWNVTVNTALPTGANSIGTVVTNADASIGAGGAPTKCHVAGAVFNTAAPAPTNGQSLALQADSAGSLSVNTEGRRNSYSCAFAFNPTVTTPTDVLTISGSATKTIRIKRVTLRFSNAANAILSPVVILKRSSADSGGTFTNPVILPHDTNNPAATAVVAMYTANPTTLGTQVGIYKYFLIYNTNTTQANFIPSEILISDWSQPGEQAPVLRGTSELMTVDLNGSTLGTGGAIYFVLEWTEE